MSYKQIADFASINNISDNPLTYCVPDALNSQFLHGADGRIFGKYNRQCGIYMSNRCSLNWDSICEEMSQNSNPNYPDMTNNSDGCCSRRLTAGEILVKDTAYLKYLLSATGCNVICEQFNPNSASSPTICYMTNSSCAIGDTRANSCGILKGQTMIEQSACPADSNASCRREYGLTESQISLLDSDPVMNKLIDKPYIAPELLGAIYDNSKMRGILPWLKPTRLGAFYTVNGYSLA
jgi:hypothetical protein